MLIHIVRHGQTDWNAIRRIQGQLESELDDTGRQQAQARGKDFNNLPLLAVYSSSSVRTRQTTKLILGQRTDTVTYRDDLREVRLGVWQGRLWADVEREFPEMVEAHRTDSPEFDVENAERSQQVQERGVAAIESIINEHKESEADDNILVVSHGAIMRTILAHYCELPLARLHTVPALPNCAHCIIQVVGDKRVVQQIAGTPFDQTEWAGA